MQSICSSGGDCIKLFTPSGQTRGRKLLGVLLTACFFNEAEKQVRGGEYL